MYKFDEEKMLNGYKGVFALRNAINEKVASFYKDLKNVCFLGIGGTWASCMQALVHMQEKSAIEVICSNAAEFNTTGNKRVGKGTLLVFSSASGTTKEIVEAVKKAKEAGAYVLGFVDTKGSVLCDLSDDYFNYPACEQLKFFMVADYLMYLEGVFSNYDDYYQEIEAYLPQALVEVGKKAEDFAVDFVAKHHEDALHYFVGAGNQYGATYSYGMCYWEEQHWMRTKSIHAAEFFHGMFEIVDKNTNVTVFVGEDSQRSLALRVALFLPKICQRYTIIDTKDYPLEGISEKYRGTVSHLVMRAVCERIDVHMEKANCHPMEIRRYYRQLEY